MSTLLQIQLIEQFLNGESVVSGDRFEHATHECACFHRAMIWHCDMVCAVNAGCEPDMGTILPHSFVTEFSQGADEVGSVDVAGNFQTARASSRTKCKRMTFGIGPGIPSPK